MALRVDAHGGTGSAPSADVVAQVRSLMSTAEQVDGFSPLSDQAFVGATRGERELVLFAEDLAEPIAAGVVGAGELDLVVHPERRGRGIGSEAIRALLSRASGELRAWAHGENPAASALLEGNAFTPVRELLRMTLSPELLPSASETPVAPAEYAGGFHTAAFSPGSAAQAEEWVRVNSAAFASHPEQGKMTVEDFLLLTREEWFDAEDLILCFDADGTPAAPHGHLAGYAWVKTVLDPASDVSSPRTSCELYALGVHPHFAGHGLGRALLGSVLDRMAQHRPERVSLYVDGDNTRAVDLYVRHGFEVEARSMQWLRR